MGMKSVIPYTLADPLVVFQEQVIRRTETDLETARRHIDAMLLGDAV